MYNTTTPLCCWHSYLQEDVEETVTCECISQSGAYGIFNTCAVKGICPGSAQKVDLVTSSGTLVKGLEPKKEELESLEET